MELQARLSERMEKGKGVEDLKAREQGRDEFLRFGLEQINESLSSSGKHEGYSGDDGDSLPSIPSTGEVGEEEAEEVVDGRNSDRKMEVDGVVVPEDVYVPAFADDVAAVACGKNLEDI